MPLALATTLDMLLLAGFAGALVLVAFFSLLIAQAYRERALALYEALLLDMERVFGPDHPYTRSTSDWIAHLQQRLHSEPQTTADPPSEASSSA